MKHVKSKYKAQLSDHSLKNHLKISHSSIGADKNKLLANEKLPDISLEMLRYMSKQLAFSITIITILR